MISGNHEDYLWIIKTYFSDPARRRHIPAGEILLKQHQPNRKLYHLVSGSLSGSNGEEDNGAEQEIFRVSPGSFLGLPSFFSGSYISHFTVRAIEDSEVVFMDRDDPLIPYKGRTTFDEQFMPIVIMELIQRQRSELQLFTEKEATYLQLIEREKEASLGKMAAGLAHELNNAVAVLYSGTNWLAEKFSADWGGRDKSLPFHSGLEQGHRLSSREKRKLQSTWRNKHGLSDRAAKALAQTGLDVSALLALELDLEQEAERLHAFWEIGATLHDMQTAARHSRHVVKSVKILGTQNTQAETLNVNDSINNALSLLYQKLKPIRLELSLAQLPNITANMGDLVQIWLNLIKNAVEALSAAKTQNPAIKILSRKHKLGIAVRIIDNGPGIPVELQCPIFEPNVTTKNSGMSFGLGLGLSIVRKLVHNLNGTIYLSSSKSGTTFEIVLPAEKQS